jgi:hypothetical protein
MFTQTTSPTRGLATCRWQALTLLDGTVLFYLLTHAGRYNATSQLGSFVADSAPDAVCATIVEATTTDRGPVQALVAREDDPWAQCTHRP